MANVEDDFAALLAESEETTKKQRRVRQGETVRGRVVEMAGDSAFVAIGAKAEAIIDLAEFRNAETGEVSLAIGDEIEATVTDDGSQSGSIILKRTIGRGGRVPGELEQAHEHGIAVEGTVTGQNKGGFDVQVAGLRAFCPASQIDLRRGDPASYVGQKLRFLVTKIEGNGRNVVVSRRDLLEQESAQQAAGTWAKLKVGAVVDGTVVSLREFGAFVDLGGVEGLIHVSELGHTRNTKAEDVLKVGERVQAQVVKVEPATKPGERGRVGLSLRALAPDPWSTVASRFPVGTQLAGKVRKLEAFGAFVELAPGIDGLVHISQITLDRRIAHPRQELEIGQTVDVTVVSIDPEKRRIGLSMVAQAKRAKEAADQAERQEADRLLAETNKGSGGLGSFADLLSAARKKS